ncbi:MAG: phosphoglucosamine mutase [Alphaproteobacteria bacterium]|nr:MAG: phosphoglucosamine mutase [Alphaproteobacteria bacterium]
MTQNNTPQSKKKYFGTDGIRGKANSFPMTADMALKVAMATGSVLRTARGGKHMDRVVIGKDTRLSGYMLEQAMSAGFISMGMDVILVGPIPTPGIAKLTRSLRADVGVMISASHNPYQDNGIKLFGPDGFKLEDEIERDIEKKIDADLSAELVAPEDLGKANRLDDALGRYIESLKRSIPRTESLAGLKVVVDCAHGAAYKVAPQVLWELEVDVIAIGNTPDGRNINDGYGATSTGALQEAVVDHGADLGIALDGDADRLIMVDEKGDKIDGDQLMAALALWFKEQGTLRGGGLVATVMSNLGLERLMKANGLDFIRTDVGDRHVVEHMRKEGFNLGGEQSGHLIMSDYATTGDGLLAALQILNYIKHKKIPASEALNMFVPCPQRLRNVRFSGDSPLHTDTVRNAISGAQKKFNGSGRVLVRPSGTESLIRVMAEGDDADMVDNVVNDLCDVIEKAAAC